MNNYFNKKLMLLLGSGLLFVFSCKKYLPDSIDNLDTSTRFTVTTFRPILGRTQVIKGAFEFGNSSVPLSIKVVNLRKIDGDEPAPELMETFPVKVWNKAYTGLETSLEEIESKRAVQNLPLFSIREHAGDIVMWDGARSSFVLCEPSPGYIFDVEISNSGGRKYQKGLRLIPQRERAYEPSNYDPINGIAEKSYVNPLLINNIKGKSSGFDLQLKDVQIFFNKNTTSTENALTFKFFDSSYNPIDPSKFDLTDWSKLVHGFEMQKTSQFVKYKVAYPIPLIAERTQYTNVSGTQAHTSFKYQRFNRFGFREVASLDFDFAIYEPGDWEIVFYFPGESPKFEND